jgi:hypothetical protein
MLRSLIKSTLKTACNIVAPLCAKKSTMTAEEARAALEAFVKQEAIATAGWYELEV